MSEFRGQSSDVDIHAKEILRSRDELDRLIAKHTGQPFEKVQKDTERDFFMTAVEAKAYGLIDQVIGYEPGVFRDQTDTSTVVIPSLA